MNSNLEGFDAWYNFKTGKTDYLLASESPTLGTVENALSYIPQHKSAQALFGMYVNDMGLSIANAMNKVLSLCAGVKEE